MIERVTYECELCHTHYSTAQEAEACEAFHIPVIGNVEAVYRQNEEYPYRLLVNFASDKTLAFDSRGYFSE